MYDQLTFVVEKTPKKGKPFLPFRVTDLNGLLSLKSLSSDLIIRIIEVRISAKQKEDGCCFLAS